MSHYKKPLPNYRLRVARKNLGWTQAKLAEEVGVSSLTIARWEKGETHPDAYSRHRLGLLLGLSEAELGFDNATEPQSSVPPSETATTTTKPESDRNETSELALQNYNQRNRQRLLDRVETVWIKGVLEHSLYRAALIELGLEERAEAVVNPWGLRIQSPNRLSQLLEQGVSLVQVYDMVGGELLILGEPGTGKTTLLLDLARNLLERARKNNNALLPVVFNLANWGVKHPPLTEWLIAELHFRYQVPRMLARNWIETDQILPLLDGLDEVETGRRAECVSAINAYRREHGIVPTVVCCRTVEYNTQLTRILLHTAVEIMPLDDTQIKNYLEQAGTELTALQAAFHHNPKLYELAKTPLMLSILTLTYSGLPVQNLPQANNGDELPEQVFNNYVKRMLSRRSSSRWRYSPDQIITWLGWLASRLAINSQTVFFLEHIQPDWLPSSRLRRWYCLLVSVIVSGLFGTAVGCLVGGSIGATLSFFDEYFKFDGVAVGVPLGAGTGLLVGILGGVVAGLYLKAEKLEVKPAEVVSWAWPTIWSDLLCSIAVGLLVAFGFPWINYWLIVELSLDYNKPSQIGGVWIIHEITAIFWAGLLYMGGNSRLLTKRENLLQTAIKALLLGLWVGLALMIVQGHFYQDQLAEWVGAHLQNPALNLLEGLVNGLASGLLGGILFGMFGSFSRLQLDINERIRPNQAIFYSLLNSLRIGLFFGTGFLIVFWLLSALSYKLVLAVGGGLAVTIIMGLPNGGIAVIKHWVLRLLLWRAGVLPLNYAKFLDFATVYILLYKVGGGYIFIHRMLLDYFAKSQNLHKND